MTDTTDLRGGILKNCKEFRSNNKMEIIRVFSRVHSAKQISKLFSTILIRFRIWSQSKTPTNLDELWQSIQQEQKSIPKEIKTKLVKNMLNHVSPFPLTRFGQNACF